MTRPINVLRGRRWAHLLLATMLVLPVLLALDSSAVSAHGAATMPGSRTWLCKLDGTHDTGDIIPNNAACADAIAQGGKQPLWDWFGVLRGDGAGRTRGFIPDGSLCSGGNTTYSGYDQGRADWPYTSLTGGAEILLTYNGWAPHPGEFRLYVTKDGFDPADTLNWDDLEDEPFSVYSADTPNAVDEINQSPEYAWTATLPNKQGRHIIYSIWERSDSQETFYGCSDVSFDGGSGEIVGIGPAGAQRVAALAPDQRPETGEQGLAAADQAGSEPPDTTPQAPPPADSGDDSGDGASLEAAPPPVDSGAEPPAATALTLHEGSTPPTTTVGSWSMVLVGLGGVAFGVVASIATWACLELRRSKQQLAELSGR